MVEAKRNPNTSKFFYRAWRGAHGVSQAVGGRQGVADAISRAPRGPQGDGGLWNRQRQLQGAIGRNAGHIRDELWPPDGRPRRRSPRHRCDILARVRPPRRGVPTVLRAAQRAVQGGRHRRRCGTFRVRQGGRRGEEQGLQREPVRFVHFMSQHVLPLSSLIRGAADGGGVRAQRSWRTRQPSWPPLN